MAIYDSSFWTIEIKTNVVDCGVDQEELGAPLVTGADLAGVVSVGAEVA